MENSSNPQTTDDGGKTVAIISYITIVGWLIALVMNSNNKTSLGGFHLRQMMGLIILAIASAILRVPLYFIPFLGWTTNFVLSICIFVLWILGLVSAANSEEKPIPVLGKLFQDWFSSIGK